MCFKVGFLFPENFNKKKKNKKCNLNNNNSINNIIIYSNISVTKK